MTLLKKIVAACGLMLMASGFNPASSQTSAQKELVITMTVEQQARCAADGGCVLVTREQFEEAMSKAYLEAMRQGYNSGVRSCTRPA